MALDQWAALLEPRSGNCKLTCRRKFRVLAVLIAMVGLALGNGGAEAATTWTLCNEGKTDLRIAYIYQNAPIYSPYPRWKVYGWVTVKPGCIDMLRTAGAMEVFVAARKRRTTGDTIMHFALNDEDPDRIVRNDAVTAERFFCVKDEPFDRELDTIDAHETCPSDYYLQLFNLYFAINPNTNYTLTLNK